MTPSIIDQLRQAKPQKRLEILKRQYDKNLKYFAKNHPAVAAGLRRIPCPYHIRVTESFLDIIHKPTGELCHPDMGLDRFAEGLGHWSHQAWVDFIDPKLRRFEEEGVHKRLVERYSESLGDAFPQYWERGRERRIDLPQTEKNKCYSNPVVFLGIFHGLHIAHYLSCTEVRSAVFIEPEPQRFPVSCYFLDYAAIDKRFNGLLLHIGDQLPDTLFDTLIAKAPITAPVWLRILPGYASRCNEQLLLYLRSRWNALSDSWVPADRKLRGFKHMATNMKDKRLLLSGKPQLSKNSRIVAVGAGPSLSDDLAWLKQNRDNSIVFAAHSAIAILRAHGIEADYQFCLDLEVDEDIYQALKFNAGVPVVVDCKCIPEFLSRFNSALMVASAGNYYPVRLSTKIDGILPTTGNLMISLACFCQPAELYLLGMDLGYRKRDETHVRGSLYDQVEGMHEKVLGGENLAVPANFPDRETVYTRGYFNEARIHVEKALASLPESCRVYNLSDGAAIQGATPKHSTEVELSHYKEKVEDLAAMQAAFTPCAAGKNWQPIPGSGKDLLRELQAGLLNELQLTAFTWPGLTQKLDMALREVSQTLQKGTRDIGRLSPFYRIIKDLLLAWYRIMVFAHSPAEAEHVYEAGLALLRETVAEFAWPEELDDLPG